MVHIDIFSSTYMMISYILVNANKTNGNVYIFFDLHSANLYKIILNLFFC